MQPGQENLRYEIITHENEDGDIVVPVPPHVLEQLGWKPGDEVDITVGQDGRIYIKKV
jgi:AbrB family looped-hinge helix DNA binding protein